MSFQLNQSKYDKLHFNTINGIKVYTGTTEFSKKKILNSISYYKNHTIENEKVFTELVPSTLTAKGQFTNINFNEEDIIDMLRTPDGGYILKIGCNYGVIVNPNPSYDPPEAKVRTSNRGRKPKIKPKSKRKVQGTGKFFSSQITFEIYNPETKKIYKIKLFRNGRFQVPGVKQPDMSDLINPISTLRDYLVDQFMDETIKVEYFISVMRNYICRIANPNILIRLNDLETLFKSQKDTDSPAIYHKFVEDNKHILFCHNIIKSYIYKKIPKVNIYYRFVERNKNILYCSDIIKKYIGKKNIIGMAEIQNNCERYFGLILKFNRPVAWKLDKRTTIKILRSGKINIDGGNSIEEIYQLYYWLKYTFIKYKSAILFDTSKLLEDSTDYDTEGNESIYDEDL